jgi:WD40 repeat protein
MGGKFSKTSSGRNKSPKKFDKDDFFINNREKLMCWSVSQEKVTKNYGKIMTGEIHSMVQTSGKNYLFLSDCNGSVKQLDVKKQKVLRDYGKHHILNTFIAITSDDRYLYTSDFLVGGWLKQFSVRSGKMIKYWGSTFHDGVSSMIITPDNKWLFAGNYDEHLEQISIDSQQKVHDYGKIHDSEICCMQTTRDSKWLITGFYDGHIKRISVENREVAKDFGQVCDGQITAMKIMADGEKLFVGDMAGHLKLISSTDGELIKHVGLAPKDCITGIVITLDQKFFFTSSFKGVLKRWNYEDNTLVKNYRKKARNIVSLC